MTASIINNLWKEPFMISSCKTVIQTDESFRETSPHGNLQYPFAFYLEDIWDFDFHRMDWHWHPELEFLVVQEGTVHCSVGIRQFDLEQGYGLFINRSILHRFEADNHAIIPNIVFSPVFLAAEQTGIYQDFIHPLVNAAIPFQIFSPEVSWQKNILDNLDSVFELQKQPSSSRLLTISLLFHLWNTLFEHLQDISGTSVRRTDMAQTKLQLMMQYIQDRFRDPLSLDEIAASASVSKSRALQIFQDHIQFSPIAYLISYRLQRAAFLLSETEKPISSIAEETGFSDSGYFCRTWKKHYGMTPKEYRNTHR